MSISLDGFVAGPDQSQDDPLGKRGKELHKWHLGDERANEDDAKASAWAMQAASTGAIQRAGTPPDRAG